MTCFFCFFTMSIKAPRNISYEWPHVKFASTFQYTKTNMRPNIFTVAKMLTVVFWVVMLTTWCHNLQAHNWQREIWSCLPCADILTGNFTYPNGVNSSINIFTYFPLFLTLVTVLVPSYLAMIAYWILH